jgi:hypothetical protein
MKAIGRGGGRGWDKEEGEREKGGKEGSTPPVFSNTPSLIYLEISLKATSPIDSRPLFLHVSDLLKTLPLGSMQTYTDLTGNSAIIRDRNEIQANLDSKIQV